MTCPACGAGVTPELRFCLSCGTALEPGCGTCGAPIVPSARFCGQCGTRIADGPPPSPSSAPGTPPVTAASAIPQVERRLVSVLFADLVGFTTRSESRDPEAVREFLTRYFEACADVVTRYGGTIEKFIGDAVMAVWGTPTTFEDDAERAVRAALELVDAVRRLPVGGPDDTDEAPVAVRAAVMTGDAAVTVGATGQGMVAGDLVNSAARLQSAAAPGVVLVDEATMRTSDQAIAYQPAGEQNLRGKVAPVPAWAALRVVAERGGAGRNAGLEAPFVARAEELRLLKDQLHATGREGRARLISVLGEAGMGKSRLAWEFLKYIDGVAEDIFWHQGRSPAYGEGIAYWALGEMVRRRAGIAESEHEAVALGKLAASVDEFVTDPAERRWIMPRLAALLGLGDAPPGGREELFAGWRTFFERISAQGTTVLLFEDLHWADDGLIDFIESLLEWSRGRPILVIALTRPSLLERRPGWGRASRASITLHLDPVASPEMTELLTGLAPGLPAEAIAHITERAEGVPLFAVETVRMLLDEGRLVREGERFRLADPAVAIAIPPSLQALIAARLDALEPGDRALLMHAAVLGRTFSTPALAAVTELDTAAVDVQLRALARKELVGLDTDPRSPEHGQYGFVHGLVREVAYGMLSRRDRRAIHLAAARHYETLGDEELTGILASHYLDAWRAAPDGPEGAAVATQARIALEAAAERALSLHANMAAVTYYQQALSVTSDPAARASLQLRAAVPAEAAQGVEAVETLVRAAMAWYDETGDLAASDRAAVILARTLMAGSRTSEALALLEPALARVDDPHAGAFQASVTNEYARAMLFELHGAQALGPIDRGLRIAEHVGAEPEMAELLASKAWALADAGRPREAAILGLGGLEIAERLGLLSTQFRARMNTSNWYMGDDPQRGLEIAGVGVERAERIGHAIWASSLAGNASMCAVITGDWDLPIGWEQLDTPGLAIAGRFAIIGPPYVVRAMRGSTATVVTDAIFEEVRGSGSPQDRGSLEALLGWEAWAAGRLDEVWPHGRAAIATYHATEAFIVLALAGRAAMWRRDAAGIRDALAALRAIGASLGTWLDAAIRQIDAAARWLENDPEGVEATFRETLGVIRRLRLRPEIAESIMGMLHLLGTDLPDAAELAAEAAAIIEDLGAVTMRRRLDLALGVTSAAEHRTTV